MNQQSKKNWWGRNWKWFVPFGCIGSIALFTGFIVLFIFLIFGIMKSSDAYKDAFAKAKAHPSVQQTIGTPIEAGMFISGNINVSGGTGQADISIPISGPDGNATIYAVATKSAGQWTFSTLTVKITGTKQRIDLLK